MVNPDNSTLSIEINPTNPLGNTLALYDESFSRPILGDTLSSYFSVTRFSAPISEVPILHFPLNPLQSNNLVSAMVISVKTAALVLHSQTVNFIAQNNLTLPTAGASSPYFTTAQRFSRVYAIHTARALIAMINASLALAFTSSGVAGATPFYTYDPVTELISLTTSAAFVAAGAFICMNEQLQNYLFGFQTYQATMGDIDEYTHVLTPVPATYVYVADERAMGLWFDIRKILVTSSTLPVVQEYTPIRDPSSGLSQGVIGSTPVLTDFIVSLDSPSQLSGYANYTPDTYRLIDMTKSTTPITRLNIQFFWVNKTGVLFPLEFSNTQTCTIRLGFYTKSLYNNEY